MSSALADGTLLAQQACFLPTSPDGLPVLGKIPGIEGAYIASGACIHMLKPCSKDILLAERVGTCTAFFQGTSMECEA